MTVPKWTKRPAQAIWDVFTTQADPIKLPQLKAMRSYVSCHKRGATVSAARRSEYPNLFKITRGEGVQDGPELEFVRKAKSVYRVAITVDNYKDFKYLRRTMGLAIELAAKFKGVIRDVHAVRLLHPKAANKLLKAKDIGMAQSMLYSQRIKKSEIPKRRVYTRGMVKFGLPDLQIDQVPDHCRRRARHILRHFIRALSVVNLGQPSLHGMYEEFPITFVNIPNGSDGFFPYERMEVRDYVEAINLVGQTAARLLQISAPDYEPGTEDDLNIPEPPPELDPKPQQPAPVATVQKSSLSLGEKKPVRPPAPPPPPPGNRGADSLSPLPTSDGDLEPSDFGEWSDGADSDSARQGDNPYQNFAEDFSIGRMIGDDGDFAGGDDMNFELDHSGEALMDESLNMLKTPHERTLSVMDSAVDERAAGMSQHQSSPPSDQLPMIHYFGNSNSTIWVFFATDKRPDLKQLIGQLATDKFVLEPQVVANTPQHLELVFSHRLEDFRLQFKIHSMERAKPHSLVGATDVPQNMKVLARVKHRALTCVEGRPTMTALVHQIKLVQALQKLTEGVVYDETAQLVWEKPRRFNFTLSDQIDVADMVNIHVEPKQKQNEQIVWIHTHGMERMQFRNIDILCLDRVWASRAVQLLTYLVRQLDMLGEVERASMTRFDIEGEDLVLHPKKEYFKLLAGRYVIGAQPDDNHRDDRLVLCDNRAGNTLYPMMITGVLDRLTRR